MSTDTVYAVLSKHALTALTLHAALTLGFVEMSYTVFESAGVATVEVEVKSGSGVGEPVVVDISTMDISAIGE